MKISVLYSTMIVKNLEESVAFYRDVLKFTEGYHVDLPFGGITIMESPDGACVELIESPQFEVGLYSVGTDVDDLDETIKALKERGCEPLGEIVPTSVIGTNCWTLEMLMETEFPQQAYELGKSL